MLLFLFSFLQFAAAQVAPAPFAPSPIGAELGVTNCEVHGRIMLRATGEPVAGLSAALTYIGYSQDGQPEPSVIGQGTVSDAGGGFRLISPRRDLYRIITGVTAADGQMYIPEEVKLDKRSCMDGLFVDIAVSKGHPITIQGGFIDGLGHRYPHLDWVWLEHRQKLMAAPVSYRSGISWKDHYRNAAGYKIENVAPGSYYLYSNRLDDILDRAETVIPIEVRDTDLNVDIVSDASYNLNGLIRFESIRIPNSVMKQVRLHLYPVDGTVLPNNRSTAIGSGGIFGFSSLPAGKFRLAITSLPEPFYIKSVRKGTVDVLNEGITLPSKVSSSVVVLIGTDGAQVSGSVRVAGKSYAPAKVILIPKRKGLLRSDLYKNVQTDDHGEFQIGGVSPGLYEIYAWKPEDVGHRDYFNPEFIKRFEERGTLVQVVGGDTKKVIVPLLQSKD